MTTSRTRLWLYPEYDENGDLNLTGDVNVPRNLNVQGVVSVFNGGAASLINVGGDGSTLVADVSLTNAEVKALRASPKTIVAAPAAGKVLEFVSGILILKAGANVLTESTANLALKYTNGSGVQVSQTVEMTGFIDQAADMVTSVLNKLDAIVTKAASDGQALVLHNLGAAEFGGNAANDATLRVRIGYKIWSTA